MIRRTMVEVWDSDLQVILERAPDPTFEATRSYHAGGTIAVFVPDGSALLEAAKTPGASIRVLADDQEFQSGPVLIANSEIGPGGEGVILAVSWWTLLARTLGYPVPTADLDNQNRNYWTKQAFSETAVKLLVEQNLVTRRGFPIVVPATQNRGVKTLIAIRMHPIIDKIQTVMDASPLVWSLAHRGDLDSLSEPLVFDGTEPTTYGLPLDYQGVILGGNWQLDSPTVTRQIVGGWGEGAARKFIVSESPDDSYMWAVEDFRDARDVQPSTEVGSEVTEQEATDELYARAAEDLAEGAQRVSLDLDLVETEAFGYRAPYEVGDHVSVTLSPDWVVTDRITDASLSVTPENGILVKASVGGAVDSPDKQLTEALRKLGIGLRKVEVV